MLSAWTPLAKMLVVALSLGATPCTPKTNDTVPCQYTCGSVTYDLTPLNESSIVQDSDASGRYGESGAVGHRCALKCTSDAQCNPAAGGRCSTGFADNFCSYATPPAPTATPLKTLLKRLASAIGPAILNGR